MALSAGLLIGGIETMALEQPDSSALNYPHAHGTRSLVYDVNREWLYTLARPVLIASIALFVLLASTYDVMRRTDDEQRKRGLAQEARKLRAPD